jgi:MFS family permease
MKNISRKDFTILLGNVVDHFDTSLYAFIAPIMAPIFFPSEDPVVQLIMAYSVFATSMVTRPLGAYLFGLLARSQGPSGALSYSLVGVGMFTLLIGFLPTHQAIGGFAAFLFIILRTIVEIFAAGESAVSRLYILNGKEEETAFKNSYLHQISTILGIVLASFAAVFVQYMNDDRSWRLMYFLGGSAAIIGYFLRKSAKDVEDIEFQKNLDLYDRFGLGALMSHKMQIFHIFMVNGISHLTYVIPFITMNHLVPLMTDIDAKTMMEINSFMLVFDMLAIAVIGKITSKIDSSFLMVLASLMLAITIIPAWYFLPDAGIVYVTILRFWIVIWGLVFLCPLNLWSYKQVSGDKKYIIAGIGSTLSASIIGKMTPAICLALYYGIGNIAVAIYFAFMFALGALLIGF